MNEAPILLDDRQMCEFIANGFLTIKMGLPEEFHRGIYEKTIGVFEKEGNPGNNILPRVPELQLVFDDPAVRGAFTSLLGEDYVMHPHRHCHANKPHGKAGGWHKDSYWGYQKVRYHRPRWAMAFYYPQDVTIENGPTGVVPGTHYYAEKFEDPDGRGKAVCGKAGTIAIVHFDIWHRAMANQTDSQRYMMKFQFTRMSEPKSPSWRTEDPVWKENGYGTRHLPVWQDMWDWSRGEKRGARTPSGPEPSHLESARSAEEPARLNAVYALGSSGAASQSTLRDLLLGDSDEIARDAAYGLSASGESAVDLLEEALGNESERVRAHAAFALGDLGTEGREGVRTLSTALQDPSPWVRHQASEALGTISSDPNSAVPALTKVLSDEDGQVGYNAAYALARFGPDAAEAAPALKTSLHSENRYTSGHSAVALQRIGTPEAIDALMEFLNTARWCPTTTPENLY